MRFVPHAITALALLLGLALLLKGWRWDPARGRRRCPRCWYLITAHEGITVCSECGTPLRDERRLGRTRRCRSMVAAGAVLVLVGTWHLGAMLTRSVLWFAPTGVLVWTAVQLDVVPTSRDSSALAQTLIRRKLTDRQHALLYGATARRNLAKVSSCIRVRPIWPASVPLSVDWAPSPGQSPLDLPFGSTFLRNAEITPSLAGMHSAFVSARWDEGVRNDPGLELGRVPAGAVIGCTVRIFDPVWRDREVYEIPIAQREIELPVAIVDKDIDDIIRPDATPELTARIRASLAPLLVTDSAATPGQVYLTFDAGLPSVPGTAIAVHAEIYHDGQLVAWVSFREARDGYLGYGTRLWLQGDTAALAGVDASWRLRLSGDRELALRTFDADRYWAGSYEVPLSSVVRATR